MAARFARRRVRRSFTLVEMLVVIVIIGILAGLITGAALVVQRRAKNAVMKAEIAEIETALVAYKEKFGDFPPDGSDTTLVKAHILRAFPYYRGTVFPTMDPSTALVFWLGGKYDATTGSFAGFSANPRDPFDASNSRIGPFYDGFLKDKTRCVAAGTSANNFPLYRFLPANGNGQSDPYVYFRARANGAYTGSIGNCKPCIDSSLTTSTTTVYIEPKKYQIRSPGLDGKFGAGIQFPDGTDYDKFQYDDLSNFCDGTFGDKIP